MKKLKVFSILLMCLVALVLMSCDDSVSYEDGGSSGVHKRLIIQNIDAGVYNTSIGITLGLFPRGTSLQQAMMMDRVVAGVEYFYNTGNNVAVTISVDLDDINGNPWTGSGVYDVYFYFSYFARLPRFFRIANVNFNLPTTSVPFANAIEVFP